MPTFELTPKQNEANQLLACGSRHIMLFGGSRSGKTFLLIRANVVRALKAKNSRHCVLRFRLGHIKSSIVLDTFPKVMRMCFPDVKYILNKSDLYAQFENGSEIWFGGLDDNERVEKILGNEYATLTFNECSQIPYSSRNVALTRLAQQCYQNIQEDYRELPLRAYYDENPPDKGHWTYQLFRVKRDPESKKPLPDPENYASMQMNPMDNASNLGVDYLHSLETLSERLKRRFMFGEFREVAPNALFIDDNIDKWRVTDQSLPDMVRIVVAIDPSGAEDENNADNDEIGIIVCGLGTDTIAYVLEDLTVKAAPATWGRVATAAYERHQADRIVAETNFGGAMVRFVIHSIRPNTPFRALTASRGKVVRAEPVSALCEVGKCRLAGSFPRLEDEMYAMTTLGYQGENSPNRVDAMVWAIYDLFPNLMAPKPKERPKAPQAPLFRATETSWMGN